ERTTDFVRSRGENGYGEKQKRGGHRHQPGARAGPSASRRVARRCQMSQPVCPQIRAQNITPDTQFTTRVAARHLAMDACLL
ncbi:MAG TPA: hypothetical protein VHX19_18340, partial [Stellaceae bacterium]|nr:hypothetical protein [Stellaceae bacterium]